MKHRLLLLCLGLFAVSHLSAQTAARPNILFIIFDDWGWQHAGAYGSTWVKTPNFDRVAREGVLFQNAFTSNPKCSPCRATILTGRNTWQLREAVSHNGMFPEGFDVYPDLLEKAGYTVGLTGKGWGPGDFKTLAKRTRNPAGPGFDEHPVRHRIEHERAVAIFDLIEANRFAPVGGFTGPYALHLSVSDTAW